MGEQTTKQTPIERLDLLAENLRTQFGSDGCEVICRYSEITMQVPKDQLIAVATQLRDGEQFLFDQIIDVCGVDYSTYGQGEWVTDDASATGFGRGVEAVSPVAMDEQFAAVYHLLSVAKNQRLRLRVSLDSEKPVVSSVVDIWNSANWYEREAFDMFGILFEGHPDLRRILTDYGFIGHPFRKDFPLTGHVEMRYDPEQQRVVYVPVTVEQRTQVPRVVRDSGQQPVEPEQQDAQDV
jgi:NADH-quinone oxidoreductase subunit C